MGFVLMGTGCYQMLKTELVCLLCCNILYDNWPYVCVHLQTGAAAVFLKLDQEKLSVCIGGRNMLLSVLSLFFL